MSHWCGVGRVSLQMVNVILCPVVAIRNECPFVIMDLIPRAVVSLFTTPSMGDCIDGTRSEIFAAIEPKLAEGLMKFQKEGVM